MVSSERYQLVSEDAPHGTQVKAIDRGYLSLPIETSDKSANWENLNELELLSTTTGILQGRQLPSTVCMPFSNGTGGLSIGQTDCREGHLGAFFPAKSIQGEAMQTLHLMTSPYAGCGDPASRAESTVLVNNAACAVGQDDSTDHSSQLQQHYFGFSSSPSIMHSPVRSVYNTTIIPQSNSQQTGLYFDGLASNTWAAGNELSFLPVNDTARLTQPLATRLACMEPGQQHRPSSSLSQLLSRPEPDERGSMVQHDIMPCLTTDSPHTSAVSNQGLSLSLSGHHNPFQLQWFGMQQAVTILNNSQGPSQDGCKDIVYTQRLVESSDPDRVTSQSNHLMAAYNSSNLDICNRQLPIQAIDQAVPVFRSYLASSKYLRAAQLLLEEVVSISCGVKNGCKQTKLQTWIGGGSLLDGLTSKVEKAASQTGPNLESGVVCVNPTIARALTSLGSEQSFAVAENNLQENQELQLKKAKLIAMLDEVDRRYKLYFSQMEAVVNTFEAAAGLGAAKTYTALALQTISKHFRGLRDAIGSQIGVASRALGEEFSSIGLHRLRYVDQQLRHQRSLQQCGMMQQHAWRPQRGLPERSVSVLRAWLFEHFLHPYPKDADKLMLARQTGLSRNQVSNWFINARVRLWKPMVEEMYIEELKESEIDRISAETSADQKSNTENSDNFRGDVSCISDQAVMAIPDSCNRHRGNEVGSKDLGPLLSEKQIASLYRPLNVLQCANVSDGAASQSQGILQERIDAAFAPCEQEPEQGDFRQDEESKSQSLHRFMSSGLDHLTNRRYPNDREGFQGVSAGCNGVSLTLGLQHPEGVAFADAQQHLYLPRDQDCLQTRTVTSSLLSQLAMPGNRRRLDEIDHNSIDSIKDYEDRREIQARKRFASNMYIQG